jgi:hypothetical protein
LQTKRFKTKILSALVTVAVVFSIIPLALFLVSSAAPDYNDLIEEIAEKLKLDENDIALWSALDIELSYENDTIHDLGNGSVAITFPIPQEMKDWHIFRFIGLDVNDTKDGFDVGEEIHGKNNFDGTVTITMSVFPDVVIMIAVDPNFDGLIGEIAAELAIAESDIKLWSALQVDLSYNNQTIQKLDNGSISITFPIPEEMLKAWYDFYFIGLDVDVDNSNSGFKVGKIIEGSNNYDGKVTIVMEEFPDAVIMVAVPSKFEDIDFFGMFKSDIERLSGYENLASLADKNLTLSAFFIDLDYNGVVIQDLGNGSISVTIPVESGFHYEFFGVGLNSAPSPGNNFKPLSTAIDEIPAVINHVAGTVTVTFSEFADAVVMLGIPSFEIIFDVDGGKTSVFTGRGGKLPLGALPPNPPDPYGEIFDGWFTAATGGTEANLTQVFTAGTTFYAQFVPDPYVLPPELGMFGDAIAYLFDGLALQNIEHYGALDIELYYDGKAIAEITGGGSVFITTPAPVQGNYHYLLMGVSNAETGTGFGFWSTGLGFDKITDDAQKLSDNRITFSLSKFYDVIIVLAVDCENPCECDYCECDCVCKDCCDAGCAECDTGGGDCCDVNALLGLYNTATGKCIDCHSCSNALMGMGCDWDCSGLADMDGCMTWWIFGAGCTDCHTYFGDVNGDGIVDMADYSYILEVVGGASFHGIGLPILIER